MAGEDLGDFAVAGEGDVDEEVVAGDAGDFDEFAVEGVVLDGAFDGALVAHEFGAMEDFDGFLGGEAWGDEFAAAGEAEHEVGFDEAEGDVEVGGDEAGVDVDGGTGGGIAEVGVFGEDFGVVVDDVDVAVEVGADDFADFVLGGGAVEAGGDKDGDVFAGDAGLGEAGEEWGEDEAIGGGASDIADGDGGGFFATGEFDEGRGADGGVEGGFEGGGTVGEGDGGAGLEELVAEAVGEVGVEACFSKSEFNTHLLQRIMFWARNASHKIFTKECASILRFGAL